MCQLSVISSAAALCIGTVARNTNDAQALAQILQFEARGAAVGVAFGTARGGSFGHR